jgi:hypothetical protein
MLRAHSYEKGSRLRGSERDVTTIMSQDLLKILGGKREKNQTSIHTC